MSAYLVIVAAAAIGIVGFDAAASLIAKHYGVNYARFAVGSNVIYALVGGVAGALHGWMLGVAAAGLTGLVEATLGWNVSWRIGPGRVDPAFMTPSNVAKTIAYVVALSVVIGGLASLFSHAAFSK